ncbi:MAG: hypothetical protein IAI50_13085 [Candidatus Eremiobacteraeota bacterium]|nr:hypothetical protein [Candidatus Eremiobacteraeota bacterium]
MENSRGPSSSGLKTCGFLISVEDCFDVKGFLIIGAILAVVVYVVDVLG